MSKGKSFFRDLVKKMDSDNVTIAADGLSVAEFSGYINTGSLSLNALISGSIFGGLPNNKCVVFAGKTQTGKTYFVLGIVKHFLDEHPDNGVIYFDTESAVKRDTLISRGIDPERVILVNVATIEEFRLQSMHFLDFYMEKKDRQGMLFVLDSLGMLASNKAMRDSMDEKKQDVRDMTLAQVIKGTFRVLRLRLAKAAIPMVITNHTYASMALYGEKEVMGGGRGPEYAADDIIFLSKTKERNEDKAVIGNIIHARAWKSRDGRENQTVDVKVSYDYGLDPYFGLLDIAERGGVLVKPKGKKYYLFGEEEIPTEDLENGTPQFWDNRKDLLDAINKAAHKMFTYHSEAEIAEFEEKDGVAV